MELLCDLIHGLSEKEIKQFKEYIAENTVSNRGNKTLMLFDLILENNEGTLDPESVMKSIFGRISKANFSWLKKNLRSKLEEFLILDSNVLKRSEYDPRDIDLVVLRKKMAQFYLLRFARNNRIAASKLLNEIIQIAEVYEFYPTLVELINLKKHSVGFKSDEKEYRKLSKKVTYYNKCLEGSIKAKDLYHEYLLLTTTKGKIEEKLIESFLENSIDELGRYLQQIKSTTVEYYFYILQIFHCAIITSYESGINICLKVLKLLEQNKSVYRKERVGILYDYLCDFEVLRGNYKTGADYALHAQKSFHPKSPNYLTSKQAEYYARFFADEYSEAEKLMHFLLENAKGGQSFRKSKYEYFYACLLFRQGKLKQSLKLTEKNIELMSDRDGWNVGIRVLSIVCMIDMGMVDDASNRIESLRKHLERLKSSNTPPRKRDLEIYEILNSLMLNSYNFDKTYLETLNRIELLSGNYKDYVWRPWGAELIRFDQWFENKIKVQDREAVKGDAALNKKKEQELPGQ